MKTPETEELVIRSFREQEEFKEGLAGFEPIIFKFTGVKNSHKF